MLVLFKAARRQEYLQQNLRILGAARGETVETAYGLRWQSEDLRRRAPEAGEEALIVFTSRPYGGFTPVRFARVVTSRREANRLHLQLELGSRAATTDPGAWRDFVLGGPNPSEASEIWAFRLEAEPRPPASGGAIGADLARPPVTYARAELDESAWRATIDGLAPDTDYATAVFLRIVSVQPADDPARGALELSYRFVAERPYLVRVASYNPHLEADRLRDVRLVPLYDELATAVVTRADEPLPSDGIVELLIEPIVAGPGWLELNASLGMDLVPAVSLGWVAEAAPAGRSAEPQRGETPAVLARAIAAADPIAEAAVRAYALVRDAGAMEPGPRLRLLEHLRTVAPDEPRLAEQEGILLYEAGHHEEAGRSLGAIPLDALGAEGRATLVASWLRTRRLPVPIERVRIADLSRPEGFHLVFDASVALRAADQVTLAEFVVGRLLSEDRAAAWLAAILERPLGGAALHELVDLWARLDPAGARAVSQRLIDAGRLGR